MTARPAHTTTAREPCFYPCVICHDLPSTCPKTLFEYPWSKVIHRIVTDDA